MSTGNYRADTPTLIAASHAQVIRAEAVLADGTIYPLPIEDGSTIGWDETRAPRVVLDLTTPVPCDDCLANLDPRFGVRVRLFAGYVHTDGYQDVYQVADLGLRRRPVDRPGNTVGLTATSDESVVIDLGPSAGGTAAGANIPTAIRGVVDGCFATARTWTVTSSDATTVSVPLQGTDKWQVCDDLADQADLDVYASALGAWTIEPRKATVATDPDLTLAVGPGGTVLSSRAEVSRDGGSVDGYANRVQLLYDWTDASNVDHHLVAVREITTGPLKATVGSIRAYEERRNIPTTQAGANAAAAALVKRMATRGRSYSVTAIAAWWTRPGLTAQIVLPSGYPEKHLVSSVDFDLGGGTMTVRTRVPDAGAVTIGGAT